jgi:outer membrane protein W
MIMSSSRIYTFIFSFIFYIAFLNTTIFSQNYKIGGAVSIASGNNNVEGGTGFSVFLDFPLQKSLTILVNVGKYSSETKVDLMSEGDYSQLWIEGSLLFTGTQTKLQPYGGGGVGYYIFDHELSSNVEYALSMLGLRGKEEINNVIGFHIRGGLNVELSPKVYLFGDVKYAFLKPKFEVKVTDISTFESVTYKEDVELNTLVLSFGIKILI